MKNKIMYSLLIFLSMLKIGIAQHKNMYKVNDVSNSSPSDCKMCTPFPQTYKPKAITLGAEFLFWQYTNEFAGDYASVALDTTTIGTNSVIPGNNADVSYDWKPGVRVYLGYNLNHDVLVNASRQYEGWDMFWIYTWNRWDDNEGSLSAVSSNSNLIFYILNDVVSTTNIAGLEKVTYNENYHFYNLDYEIGRNYFLASYVNFRPHWGLRGSLYKQQIHVTIDDAIRPGEANLVYNIESFNTDDVRAIGMKAGIDTSWYMTQNWSFLANANFAYLYARHHLSEKIISVDQAVFQTVLRSKGTRTLHSLIPESEFRLGLQWDAWFDDDSYRTVFNFCWEFLYLYEGTAQIGDNNAIQRNSPSIQGFTMNLGFQF